MASDYSSDDNFYGEDEEEEGVAEIELKPCTNCGRNFNPDVLTRHYNVCTKLKTRKAFDSKKQRLKEIEKVPISVPPTAAPPKPKKKDWRWQHQEFIKNIRAARGVKSGDPAPAPSPTINPDYVQCPHCMRRFNETAAERHIEFCKEQKSRIPKQQSDSKFASKKEKMEKRSTYKPPLPGQKKKSTSNLPKARTNSNSAPSSQRVKGKPSPSPSNGERGAKSDTTISGQRRKKVTEAQPDERPETLTNARYSKTHSASSRNSSGGSVTDNDSSKNRSGKNKSGNEPKWFEDLKRNDSGNQLRRNKLQNDLDAVDSGLDINENYPRTTLMSKTKNVKESPVGVVRPSSRTMESEFVLEKSERTVNSGRRKMANFCHDCGTKYPVPEAKFCCECGVRRMALT